MGQLTAAVTLGALEDLGGIEAITGTDEGGLGQLTPSATHAQVLPARERDALLLTPVETQTTSRDKAEDARRVTSRPGRRGLNVQREPLGKKLERTLAVAPLVHPKPHTAHTHSRWSGGL